MKNVKKISKRVEEIVNLVPKCNSLADVGCDHAQISIFLKEIGRTDFVIASDLREGPLQRAKENVAKKNLEESFQFRLCSGLADYEKGETEVILISGMGGILISSILEEGREVIEGASCLVLEPQSDAHLVRRWLKEAGFSITDERFVKEGMKYYPVIRAERTGESSTDNRVFEKYGKLLLTRREPLLKEFLSKKRESLRKILEGEGLKEGKSLLLKERYSFLSEEMKDVEEALQYYEEKG